MLRFHPVQTDQSPAGFVLPDVALSGATESSVLLDSATLALLGWTLAPMPEAGEARFGADPGPRGVWRSLVWEEQDLGGRRYTRFFALLHFDNIAQLHAGPIRIVPEGGGDEALLPPIGRVDLDGALLASRLRAPCALGSVVFDFLREAVARPPFADSERIEQFMLGLLRSTSQQNGFVEIFGRPECNGLLVQGWSFALGAGIHTLLIDHGALTACEAVVGTFARADLLESAHGIVAYFKDARDDAHLAVRRIYVRGEDGYIHLDLVDAPLRLQPADAVPHLRDMLPSVVGEPAVIRALKRICRPRFEGVDTQQIRETPVRVAIDRVLHVPGTGFLVAGWMLDPRRLVKLALLKSTANFYRRLHERWQRLPRPDVSDGFAADPGFGPHLRPGDDLHGFVCFVQRTEPLAEGETFYLELVLEDESCIFLPVAVDARPADLGARDILSGINIDDPAFDEIVARHLGPAVSEAFAHRSATGQALSVIPLGEPSSWAAVSIVVPVDGDGGDLDINLARFAGDPDLEAAEFVFVASRAAADALARRLRHQMAFYGFAGSLVVTAEPLGQFEALELGAAHGRGELLLFLAQTVFPQEPGWLWDLIAQLNADPDAVAVSPTLLYEDLSIRYAGQSLRHEAHTDPSDEPSRGFTGYPHHWLQADKARRVEAIAGECCLVRRDVFTAAGGFSREFAGPEFKAADLALRLVRAGAACLWAPMVTMFALDTEAPAEPQDYWMKPAQRVDAWRFAAKWAAAGAGAETIVP
jgi:GT2 family glycosyltransferase